MLFKTGSNTVHTKAPSKVFFFFLIKMHIVIYDDINLQKLVVSTQPVADDCAASPMATISWDVKESS